MPMTVEAIYENGVLTPSLPLPLQDQQKVMITVHLGTTWAQRTAGIMGWAGSTELANYIATDPELDHPAPDLT